MHAGLKTRWLSEVETLRQYLKGLSTILRRNLFFLALVLSSFIVRK